MKVMVLVAGLALSPLALGSPYWGANDPPKGRYDLAAAVDSVVPTESCWKIEIGHSLKGRTVTPPEPGLEWREQLYYMAYHGDFDVEFDPDRCVVKIVKGSPAPPRLASSATGTSLGGGAQLRSEAAPVDAAAVGGAANVAGTHESMWIPVEQTASVKQATPLELDSLREGVVIDDAGAGIPGDRNAGPRTYESLEELLNERIRVDNVRDATVEEALRAVLPDGWVIDTGAMEESIRDLRVDLTTGQARGAVLSDLARELSASYHPYVEFNRFVLAPKR